VRNGNGGGERVEGLTKPVAVVGSRTEADLIVGLLESHGVRAVAAADDAGGQEPQWQLQGVLVRVAPSDEATARHLLDVTHDPADVADDTAGRQE
jgi:hypothetical protein